MTVCVFALPLGWTMTVQQDSPRGCYRLPPDGFPGALPLAWLAKGEAGAASFGFSFLGFLASRLPRFSPLAMAYLRSGWDGFSVGRRRVEQMIEVGHHAVDQLAPAWIDRSRTLGEEAQQIACFLDCLRPIRSRSGREQIFEFRLSRVQRRLLRFDLGSQPAQLGCLLGCHAAMRVEAGRVIHHGPISRVRRLVVLTFKLAQSAARPASWPAVRSVRPARG